MAETPGGGSAAQRAPEMSAPSSFGSCIAPGYCPNTRYWRRENSCGTCSPVAAAVAGSERRTPCSGRGRSKRPSAAAALEYSGTVAKAYSRTIWTSSN